VENGNEDGNEEATNETPGIAIEEHNDDDDTTVNDGITGVHIPGVTTDDGGNTGVHTPGVTTEDGGNTGVHSDTIEDDGATVMHSETAEDGGVTGVRMETTGVVINENNEDNPPTLEPSTNDSDSDSDDEDGDAGEGNDGIEIHHDKIPCEEVYHPDTMTPSVQRTYGLMPKRTRDYIHMFSHATVMHHVMTQ
jgi:hypothetical protein